MRSFVVVAACITLLSSPVAGLGLPADGPAVSAPLTANRWTAWYEASTGLPAPPVLASLAPALDDLFPYAPRGDPDPTPEVHAGWMRNYCNVVLHYDCVYNDPTGHSYECDGDWDLHPAFHLWRSDPSIVLMNHTIYDTQTEGWLDDELEEETGINSPLNKGGEALHVVLVGTTCYFDVFNDVYAQTSGIGFYFPL